VGSVLKNILDVDYQALFTFDLPSESKPLLHKSIPDAFSNMRRVYDVIEETARL
jgi:hypothetical protein